MLYLDLSTSKMMEVLQISAKTFKQTIPMPVKYFFTKYIRTEFASSLIVEMSVLIRCMLNSRILSLLSTTQFKVKNCEKLVV